MFRKKALAVFIIGVLVLPGCAQTQTQQPNNIDQILALTAQAMLATQMSSQTGGNPTLPIVIPTSEGAGEPTPITSPASITITSIQETGRGQAIVSWDAIGDFPSGFRLVWTTEEKKPTYPEDLSSYTGDPYARSALFSGTPGTIYLLRICRYINDTCDVYSNLGIFAFSNIKPSATPKVTKTVWPTYLSGGGTGKTSTPTTAIKITSIAGGTNGKALIEWTTSTNPSKGFKILYSKTNSTPTLGTDPYYVISDGAARSAYVDGTSATKYYYRLCAYNGTTCESYSQVVAFTFPTITPSATPSATTDPAVITITSITNLSAGAATINWSATGTFSSGFKILYSTTNSTPTYGAAEMVVVSDGSLRTATVNGVPRSRYYYRICKFTGSACSVYSNVVEFTYADISEDATIDFSADGTFTDAGKVKLDWVLPSGDNAGGYLILQAYPDTPMFPEAVKYTVSDPTARTYTVTGLSSGMVYNFRLCLYNGTICTAYSETAADVTVP